MEMAQSVMHTDLNVIFLVVCFMMIITLSPVCPYLPLQSIPARPCPEVLSNGPSMAIKNVGMFIQLFAKLLPLIPRRVRHC